jgi:hypothetical protein
MTKKNDNSTSPTNTVERMPFQDVDNVFCALHEAFNIGNTEEIDQRFLSLWWGFLSMSGWTENEYWDAVETLDQGKCPDCGESMDHDEELTDEEIIKNNVVSLVPPKKNEMN